MVATLPGRSLSPPQVLQAASARPSSHRVMVNLLGLPEGQAASLEDRLAALRREPGFHLHWYDKQGESAGRKLGHVTVVLEASDAQSRRQQAMAALERLRAIWPLPLN